MHSVQIFNIDFQTAFIIETLAYFALDAFWAYKQIAGPG